jgi:NitT/TauT family transport system substrate-binding protein
MNDLRTVLMVGMLAAAAVTIGSIQTGHAETSKTCEKMVLAVTPWPGSASLYVAREKGYLKNEGINAVFQSHASGHLGFESVISGEADLATVGDTPFVMAVIRGEPVAVIATLCEINRAILIVARKDRDILSREDLRGKTIGVVPGTTAEFFLHIFLTMSYISLEDVSIVPLKTDDVVGAVVSGRVDAVSTWAPHTKLAAQKLGENGVLFEDPGIYKMTWNIAGGKDSIKKHPERIQSFLRAVVRANTFIAEHPDEARTITSQYMGVGSLIPFEEWKDYAFTASLEQSLLLNLEDQARWVIKKYLGSTRNPPNFMHFIEADGLKGVEPAAVRITGK